MRYLVLLLPALVWASGFQSVRLVETSSGGVSSKAVVTHNANGREVPVETSEERVLTDTPGLKIIEKKVRRFDANGNPGPTEQVRTEIRTEADGTVRTTASVLRGDINGALMLAERSVAITRGSGDHSQTTTTMERPTLNSGFEVVEQREVTSRAVGAGRVSETSVIQRPDPNGRLVEAARRTVERAESPAGTSENAAEFEATGAGPMRLVRQTVTRSDPSGRREIDVFEPSSAGRVQGADAKLQLTKRQVVETRATPTGTVETVSAAFPLASDPSRVGALSKVEETVCTGDCGKKK